MLVFYTEGRLLRVNTSFGKLEAVAELSPGNNMLGTKMRAPRSAISQMRVRAEAYLKCCKGVGAPGASCGRAQWGEAGVFVSSPALDWL